MITFETVKNVFLRIVGIMSSQKSPKTITFEKSRLKDEMKLHTGSGVNNACTYDDVAKILGFSSGKTIINKNYTFKLPIAEKLSSAWGVRLEYLQGLDNFRTQSDFADFVFKDKKERALMRDDFFRGLGIDYKIARLSFCDKAEWKKDFEKLPHKYIPEQDYYVISVTSREIERLMAENGLLAETYYLFLDNDDNIVNVIDRFSFDDIYEMLRVNVFSILETVLHYSDKTFWRKKEFFDTEKNFLNMLLNNSDLRKQE